MTPETCPRCGARVIDREASHCWRCVASFTGEESAAEPPRTETSEAVSIGPLRAVSEAIGVGLAPPAHAEGVFPREPPQRPVREEPATDTPSLAIVGVMVSVLGILFLTQTGALGVALLFVAAFLPSLVRVAYFTMKRRRSSQRPLIWGEYVLFFFTSLGVVGAMGVVSLISFCITYFAIGFGSLILGIGIDTVYESGGGFMPVAIGGGILVALVVLLLTIRYFWLRKV